MFGRFFTPYDPNALVGDPTETPSSDHWLGTDGLGRDIFSRLLVGGATIILIAIVAVSLACLIGGAAGVFGAYRGGRADVLITRTFDLLMALPPLRIVLAVIAGVRHVRVWC